MKEKLPPNFRESEIIEVIHIRVLEGDGHKEMARVVDYYTNLSGKILAINDSIKEVKAE